MIKGPANVHVGGDCRIFGCLVSNSIVKVPYGKTLPLEPVRGCTLRIDLEPGGRAWRASSLLAGSIMWRRQIRSILAAARSRKHIVVLTIGETDTGKSSFALFLANEAIQAGFLTCIVDSDIGQGDLAPPGVMGATQISKQLVDLRTVSAISYRFVGSTTPPGFEKIIIQGIFELVDAMKTVGNIVIVNTDGFITDGGVKYKSEIARAINPDFVIILGRIAGFGLLASGSWRVLRVRANRYGAKSRFARTMRRAEQLERYIGDEQVSIKTSSLKFVYKAELFSADALKEVLGSLEGLFVGLESEGRIKGFGALISLNSQETVIKTEIDRFDTVYFSKIRM